MQIVADIGATNARFRLVNELEWCSDVLVLQTAAYETGVALLKDMLGQFSESSNNIDAAVLAVAGPPDESGDAVITNTGLVIHREAIAALLNCKVQVVNDFYALAAGLPWLTDLRHLRDLTPTQGTRAVLGPGSGLGMATVTPLSAQDIGAEVRWQVLSGEGGHADLAPGSPLEIELWQLLAQTHGHVSWETVLCGPGLTRLYDAMCGIWGVRVEGKSAAEITAAGVDMSDPVCHQTLETFCGLLGAAAGNLALTVGARGGVYIGGGIMPRIADFVGSSPLRRRFEERGLMADYVADIPLLLIEEKDPGLVGARACLGTSLS